MTVEQRAKIDSILKVTRVEQDCDTPFEWRLLQALQDSVAEIDALTDAVKRMVNIDRALNPLNEGWLDTCDNVLTYVDDATYERADQMAEGESVTLEPNEDTALLDHFAGIALAELLRAKPSLAELELVPARAYSLARAMLKARETSQP